MAEEETSEGVGTAPLDEVESAVVHALESGDESGLRILGYGEISLVIGWPTQRPEFACKRLPPFADKAAADAYAEQFDAYMRVLAGAGVEPVPSSLHILEGQHDVTAYVVQPVLDADSLGPEVLRNCEPDPEHPLLVAIADSVIRTCDERTGLDAQVSNWVFTEGRIRYLDVTTPMTFDPDGKPLLDLDVFLAAYPWALRGVLGRFVAPGVISAYRDPRNVMVDFTANLLKEQLSDWVPAAIAAANRVVSPAIDSNEVTRYYRSDARLWEVMSRLRSADRWWQRKVRRRTYPFLLPGRVQR